jgi:hypothetical protein
MLVPVLPNIESGKAIWSWHIKFQQIPSWLLHALIGLFHDISMPTIRPKLYLQTLPLWWASTTFSPWFPAMANEPSMVRRHSRLSDGGIMDRRHSQPKIRRGPLPQAGKLWENCGKHNGGVTFSADSTWFYHIYPYSTSSFQFICLFDPSIGVLEAIGDWPQESSRPRTWTRNLTPISGPLGPQRWLKRWYRIHVSSMRFIAHAKITCSCVIHIISLAGLPNPNNPMIWNMSFRFTVLFSPTRNLANQRGTCCSNTFLSWSPSISRQVVVRNFIAEADAGFFYSRL